MDSRRNSRFGGFPFPLERCDRRAPLPPCYSNQNLDEFLGPDGQPLPSSQCPNEYTAISYYPTQKTRSLDSVQGYKRLSMRLSVAMPSYAEHPSTPPATNPAQPQTRPVGSNTRNYDGSSMVGSDYGSCEEVMFWGWYKINCPRFYQSLAALWSSLWWTLEKKQQQICKKVCVSVCTFVTLDGTRVFKDSFDTLAGDTERNSILCVSAETTYC